MSQLQLIILMCLAENDQPASMLDEPTLKSNVYKQAVKQLEEKDIITITDDVMELTPKGETFTVEVYHMFRKFKIFNVIG